MMNAKLLLTNKKGFTLIETLIAMLLLAIILTGGIMLYVQAEAIMTLAMHKRMATQVTSSRMESLKAIPFDQLKAEDGKIENVVLGGLSGIQSIEVIDDPNGEGFKQVTVALNWKESTKNESSRVELVTNIVP